MDFAKPVFGLARWVWILIALLLAIAAAWWVVTSFIGGKSAKVEARLSKNQAEAALESGADAVETVGTVGAAEAKIDITTRENERAIRNAPGADAPVTAELDAVARERLCRRAVYRVRPECLQYPPAD